MSMRGKRAEKRLTMKNKRKPDDRCFLIKCAWLGPYFEVMQEDQLSEASL